MAERSDEHGGPGWWRVQGFGREVHPAGRRYWWDNRGRDPEGAVVVQATLAGRIVLRRFGGDGPAVDTPVGPGDVLAFRYGDATAYGQPDGAPLPQAYRPAWVVLEGPGVREHFEALRRAGGEVVRGEPMLVDAVASLAALAGGPDAGPSSPSLVAVSAYALVVRLIAAGIDRGRAALPPVQRAINRLREDPLRDWSLKRLAAEHGVTREHLTRVFTDQLGQPPHAWLTRRRLDHAITLLRGSDLPLADVARQAGYGSPHTLARQVRRHTGLAPATLRRQRQRRPPR
jgi:AraC-like DNA-binding protein